MRSSAWKFLCVLQWLSRVLYLWSYNFSNGKYCYFVVLRKCWDITEPRLSRHCIKWTACTLSLSLFLNHTDPKQPLCDPWLAQTVVQHLEAGVRMGPEFVSVYKPFTKKEDIKCACPVMTGNCCPYLECVLAQIMEAMAVTQTVQFWGHNTNGDWTCPQNVYNSQSCPAILLCQLALVKRGPFLKLRIIPWEGFNLAWTLHRVFQISGSLYNRFDSVCRGTDTAHSNCHISRWNYALQLSLKLPIPLCKPCQSLLSLETSCMQSWQSFLGLAHHLVRWFFSWPPHFPPKALPWGLILCGILCCLFSVTSIWTARLWYQKSYPHAVRSINLYSWTIWHALQCGHVFCSFLDS